MNRLRGVLLGTILAMVSWACSDNESPPPPSPDASAEADAAGPDGGSNTVDSGPDGVPRASVLGRLTLPAPAAGKPYGVRILTMPNLIWAQTSGVTPEGLKLDYTIDNVPPGTYFVLAFVDVDASGGDSSTPGDFVGWYGHTGDGNPPRSPNATVPETGTVLFDFNLVVR